MSETSSATSQAEPAAKKPEAPAPPPASPAPAAAGYQPRLVTVHAVNWANILDFTHLFRGFRLAINPAKILIALLAITLIYVAGRTFDAAWGRQAPKNAIELYAAQRPEIRPAAIGQAEQTRQLELNRLLIEEGSASFNEREELKTNAGAAYAKLKAAYLKQFHDALDAAHNERDMADKAAAGVHFPPGGSPAELEQQARARAASQLLTRMQALDDATGRGIFATFLKYETTQFDNLVANTLAFAHIIPARPDAAAARNDAQAQPVSGSLFTPDANRLWRSDTVAGCIANMAITAPAWLFTAAGPMQWRPDNADTWGGWLKMIGWRGLYLASLLALALFALVVLALAGASIARLSALELAGIERAPLKDVFAFAFRRLTVFLRAPVAPFLIVLAAGVLLGLFALVGAIPWIGPLVIGVLFFVFLGVCFVIMLLTLGIIGGFNLLYPTIAVEGADAFDAMSRSFAYAYARPWRLIFYTLVALIYGVLTFLFVSFAVYLVLMLAHTFVGWGMNVFGVHYGTYSGVPALDTLWPMPRFLQLVQPINWLAMSWPEYVGALFLHFWVFLAITATGAYVISYYFSSHTIMYLLLRRSVDGQNLREVYMEEGGEVGFRV